MILKYSCLNKNFSASKTKLLMWFDRTSIIVHYWIKFGILNTYDFLRWIRFSQNPSRFVSVLQQLLHKLTSTIYTNRSCLSHRRYQILRSSKWNKNPDSISFTQKESYTKACDLHECWVLCGCPHCEQLGNTSLYQLNFTIGDVLWRQGVNISNVTLQ